MDPILICFLAFGLVILLLLLRVPIAFALLIGASLGLYVLYSWPADENLTQAAVSGQR